MDYEIHLRYIYLKPISQEEDEDVESPPTNLQKQETDVGSAESMSIDVATTEAVVPQINASGELDLSGRWKSDAASSSKLAAGEEVPQSSAHSYEEQFSLPKKRAPEPVDRQSVDLSGLSIHELKELTGKYSI